MTPIDYLGPATSAQRTSTATSVAGVPLILGTPTHDGYRFALDESLAVTTIMGQKSMLLITDGAPTQELGCGPLLQAGSPTQPIIDDIAAAHADGIRTYVIGAPGSEENGQTGEDLRGWLSDAAVAGGTAAEGCTGMEPSFCHFDMTQAPDFATALAEGLAEISENVADLCTFEMPEPPEGMTSNDINLTSVILKWGDGSAELVQRDDDVAGCTEGWIVNAEGQIALCDATCARVEVDRDAEATVSMGCDPAVIVVR
jgi:hypothetical protein